MATPVMVYADQLAAHVGSYSFLYNTYYASNSSARSVLSTLKSNLDTYGIAINGCDSSAYTLRYSDSYPYCTMANWYTDYTDFSGTGVFCFSTQALCKKFSGLRTDGTYNANNKTYMTKGYWFDYDTYATAVTYLNASDISYAKRTIYIGNDEMFTCNETCADDTGWQLASGETYESWFAQYCPNSTTSTCTRNSSSRKFRCPAGYYNAQGTSATVSGSPSSLTCTSCPTLPKRDGTTCAIANPVAGSGTSITSCGLAAGCESYDYTGDFLLEGQCFYPEPDTTTAGITTTVQQAISNCVGYDVSDYSMTTTLDSLGIDSTGAAEIAATINQEYGLSITAEDILLCSTIQGVVDFIEYSFKYA